MATEGVGIESEEGPVPVEDDGVGGGARGSGGRRATGRRGAERRNERPDGIGVAFPGYSKKR